MENIINLTPHDVVLKNDGNGEKKTFKSEGATFRLEKKTLITGKLNGFPVMVEKTTGFVFNGETFKSESELLNALTQQYGYDTIFVTSAMMLQELESNRFVAPATNMAERNEKGHIISVPGFVSK